MNRRKAFAIAGVNLRRLLRDKTGAFFIFVFPFLIILALGAAFGSGFTPHARRGGTANGPARWDRISGPVRGDRGPRRSGRSPMRTRSAPPWSEARSKAGWSIPAGYDERIRAGETVPLTFIARPAGGHGAADDVVTGVVDQQSVVVRAARFAVSEGAAPGFDEALDDGRGVAGDVPDGRRGSARTAGGDTQIGTFAERARRRS